MNTKISTDVVALDEEIQYFIEETDWVLFEGFLLFRFMWKNAVDRSVTLPYVAIRTNCSSFAVAGTFSDLFRKEVIA